MKSFPVSGKVYRTKDSSGYIFIWKIKKGIITYDYLFGWEGLTKRTMSLEIFRRLGYSPFKGEGLNPTVKARYDHQLMRRINKLCE